MQSFSTSFRHYYLCGREIDIDEMCIHFKGRHRCKCYNPNKPHKWHFKAYCLNCSKTGYLSNFFMYRGKDEQRPAGMSATTYPVHKLTDHEDYHGKDHLLAIDNWYTSIPVAKLVKSEPRRMNMVGTIKANREGIPKSKLFPKNGRNKKVRGTIKCYSNVVEGVNYYFTCWQDSKPVHLLSTFPPARTPVLRNSKDNTGRYVQIQVDRPTNIENYNRSMGGTDLFDQFGSYYKTTFRSLHWQQRIYSHFLQSSAINAHILHRSVTRSENTLLEFMENLIMRWSGMDLPDVQEEVESELDDDIAPQRKRKSLLGDYEGRRRGFHYTIETPNSLPPTAKNGSRVNNRARCRVCQQPTRFQCGLCKVNLCVKGAQLDNCFYKFHHCKDFHN